jgi:hypothetical protein
MSRQYLRGWAANKTGEARRTKQGILSKLEEVDKKQECQDVESDPWRERYQLEASLDQIYHKEEIYWQQRGSENGSWMEMQILHSSIRVLMEGGGKPSFVP